MNNFLSEKQNIEVCFKGHEDDLNAIRDYQKKAMTLIHSFNPEDACLPDLKAAAALCAEASKTRVGASRISGRESIRPAFISDDDRQFCCRLYDACFDRIKAQDRMFMADPVERCTPDSSRLKFLMRQFLNKRSDGAIAAQSEGKSFNRLFGSRG